MDQKSLEAFKEVFLSHGIDEEFLDKWFGNYTVKTPAQKTALDTVKMLNGTNRPLIMIGKFGGGKTHLACSIVKNALIARKQAYYYTMTELFREYRCSLSNPERDEMAFFNKIFTAEVLAIDEINIRSDSEAENRILQEIVDRRYAKRKQTIFIANLTLEEMSEILTERLMDRLKGQKAAIVTFNWESHR